MGQVKLEYGWEDQYLPCKIKDIDGDYDVINIYVDLTTVPVDVIRNQGMAGVRRRMTILWRMTRSKDREIMSKFLNNKKIEWHIIKNWKSLPIIFRIVSVVNKKDDVLNVLKDYPEICSLIEQFDSNEEE